MTKNPLRKLLKAFILIVVIRMHVSKWEAVIVSRSRTPRGTRIILLQVIRRVGSSSSLSIQEIRSCGDVQVCFNNLPSNPEFTGTSAKRM